MSNFNFATLLQKKTLQRAAGFALVAGVLFIVDLVIDNASGTHTLLEWHHFVLYLIFTLFCFFFYINAVIMNQQTEVNLRKSRDDLEVIVSDRTAELERANQNLQAEITERLQIQKEREQIYAQAEFARQQALLLSEELQLANSTFRALLDTMPVGLVMTDSDGMLTMANQLARSILGDDLTGATETLKENCVVCRVDGTCFPPEELPLNRAIHHGEIVTNVEALLWQDDGTKTYVLLSASPVQEETGLVINAVEIIQDITGLKRMEQALRESEERYRTQFDIFPEPNSVWDRNGELLLLNNVSARFLGGLREDFLGKTVTDIYGSGGRGYRERIQRVIDTGNTEVFEDELTLPQGKRIFWTTMQRVQNPDGQYVAQVIAYDITERKQAEEALQASEKKFSSVFEFSPDGIAILRLPDLYLLDINPAFVRMLGFPREAIMGTNWQKLELMPILAQREMLEENFRELGRLVDFELALNSYPEGKNVVLLSLIHMQLGDESGLLAIVHDITKRKRSEEALLKAQEELARSVEERITLKERQRLARELHDSVSQALYGISLGAHTALAQIDGERGRIVDAMNYVISLAQAGLAEMRALIFELRPESLEQEGLVTALTKQIAALRARYSLEVNMQGCDEPDCSLVVKETLYRIAQESLHNAVKHARPNRLDIILDCTNKEIEITIRDDGIGFDPNKNYPGHLGLKSMRERALRLGGRLEITSEPGKGTQVHAVLPFEETEQQGENERVSI